MVSNYADVDDKIIKVAKECGISEAEVTDKFIKAYNEDASDTPFQSLKLLTPELPGIWMRSLHFIKLLNR